MAKALYSNRGISTLASGINGAATSITVTTGEGARFPTISGGDYFWATLANSTESVATYEIVKVTARSGDVMTVTRAQQGTSAASWSTGDKFENRIIDDDLNQPRDVAYGGTGADLSATSGIIKQASSGSAFTGSAAASDLSNGVTGSGAVVLATSATLVTPSLGTPSALVGTNITGTASSLSIGGNAATVTVADAGGDTTTWVLLGTSQTGSLAPATDAGLTYNATTDTLTTTTFVGALTGNASTATSAATLTTARTIAGVSFNGSANIAIPSTGLSDSTDLARLTTNAGQRFSVDTGFLSGCFSLYNGVATEVLNFVISGTFGATRTVQYLDPGGTVALVLAPTSTTATHVLCATATAGQPAFRALAAGDLPNHSAALITSGTLALARGGTNADLSATGGASQVLKQSSVGAAVTVGTLASTNLSDTANIVLVDGVQDISGAKTFDSAIFQSASMRWCDTNDAGAGLVPTATGSFGANRTLNYTDPGATVSMMFGSSTSTTTTHVLHATATAGVYAPSALVAGDIPSLPASQITTGQLAVARGGTALDGSATGGANKAVWQESAGGAFTVRVIAVADLPTFTNFTEQVLPNYFDDYVPYYDGSAAANRKCLPIALTIDNGRDRWAIDNDCFGAADAGFLLGGSGGSGTAGTGDNNHPGILVSSTSTSSTGSAGWFRGSAGGTSGIRLGNGRVHFLCICRVTTLSDGTDTFTCRWGLGDAVSAESTDGVFFRYTHGTNSGRYEAVCRSNSTETTADTGVAAAASSTTMKCFEAEVNAAGNSVVFYIDGASVATITTNIPTAAGRELTCLFGQILKSAGTTARTIHTDLYQCWGELVTQRW